MLNLLWLLQVEPIVAVEVYKACAELNLQPGSFMDPLEERATHRFGQRYQNMAPRTNISITCATAGFHKV